MLTEADPNPIEVIAEVDAGATVALTRRLASKDHDHLEKTLGLTVDRVVETYPLVIRLRPTGWSSWGGRGFTGSAEPFNWRPDNRLSFTLYGPVSRAAERVRPAPMERKTGSRRCRCAGTV
jgi:hypothetical protein